MSPPAAPPVDRTVLADRLHLALEAPERAASWHRLFKAANRCGGAERTELCEKVRAQRPAEGIAAILASTFIDALRGDEFELRTAADAFLRSRLPLDAGLAVLNIIYSRSMRRGLGRAGLVRIQRGCGLVELSRGIGERLLRERAALPPLAAAGAQVRRAAVVAPTLSIIQHAPTRMALDHACLLHDQGLQVTAFTPQEHRMPDLADWLGFPGRIELAPANSSGWPRPKVGELPVILAKPGLSMRGRWHSLLNEIEKFAPDAILFIGPYSPLLWPLRARWPVVGLSTNSITPAGPLDVWLAPGAGAEPAFSPPLDKPLVRAHSNRLSVTLSQKAKPRAKLGISEKGIVWMTSSTMFGRDMPGAWCARVRDALERHPSAHWLIVKSSTAPLPGLEGHPRVVAVQYQKDFGAALLACDLYLNPPRTGGGHSVAMAMAHGVPALSLEGGDGGDKVGPAAAGDDADYFARLDAWTRDAGARRAAGAAQRERFRSTFDLAASGPGLVEALAQAMAIRARR